MIVLIVREPRPDAAFWPGRRWLAAVDSVIWPLAWALLLLRVPAAQGLVKPVFAVASLYVLLRLYAAIWVNHRYWFTTWRWARFVALLLLVWIVLKVSMST